ncbi:hypothetical protein ASG70_08090 [Phycicoccus sp. Soil748]|nr:hypothetical protein ASG70_08090 [Phycicoccus sp. Soil748]
MGIEEPVEMIHVEGPTQCRCGEPLRAGERAGLVGDDPAPTCLWCLADLQAGRPRPARRKGTQQWETTTRAGFPGSSPVPSSVTDLAHARRSRQRRTRRTRSSGGPRTAITLLVTALVVELALWGRPLLFHDVPSTSAITGVTVGSHGIDFAQPAPVQVDAGGGIRAMWPPVPADAKDEPLGRPPFSHSTSTDYAFMQQTSGPTSAPVAWDPCRPIHLVVNAAEAPAGADRLLLEAASEVSRATGLQFVIEGPTDEVPHSDRQPVDSARYGNRWSPALVAWTTPAVVPELAGRVAGIGGPRGATYAKNVDKHWVSGIVFLDGPTFVDILRRSDGWAQARAIVMHELSHMVGLTHVQKPDELMYSDNNGRTTFGKGDLEGLRRLGVGRCFTK